MEDRLPTIAIGQHCGQKERMSTSFAETLPNECPPIDAIDQALKPAFRIVDGSTVNGEHFKSHAAKGMSPPTNLDACRWASCSLFLEKEAAIAMTKLPRKRMAAPHIAELSISAGSGCSKVNSSTKHVDFWMYAGFDPTKALIKLEPVNG